MQSSLADASRYCAHCSRALSENSPKEGDCINREVDSPAIAAPGLPAVQTRPPVQLRSGKCTQSVVPIRFSIDVQVGLVDHLPSFVAGNAHRL